MNHRLNKVEQKFTNIQIAFDFLPVLILRDHSKWRANKDEYGEGIMLIRTFVLKVINNKTKNEPIMKSLIALQNELESVITQVCKESKL